MQRGINCKNQLQLQLQSVLLNAAKPQTQMHSLPLSAIKVLGLLTLVKVTKPEQQAAAQQALTQMTAGRMPGCLTLW